MKSLMAQPLTVHYSINDVNGSSAKKMLWTQKTKFENFKMCKKYYFILQVSFNFKQKETKFTL